MPTRLAFRRPPRRPDVRVPCQARLPAGLTLAAPSEVGLDSGRRPFYGGPPTPAVTGRDTAWAVPGAALLRDVAFEDGVIQVGVSPGFPAPALVATLRHPARGGAIGVWSMATVSPAMQYAHFRYAARPRSGGAGAPPPATAVSPGGRDPEGAVAAATRRRRRRLPGARQRAPVAARATLTRERAGAARLAFAYCDRAALILNGRRAGRGPAPRPRRAAAAAPPVQRPEHGERLYRARACHGAPPQPPVSRRRVRFGR